MVIVKSPVGLPGRVVRNQFIDQVKRGEKKPFKCPFHCVKTCKPDQSPFCIALALANARNGKFKHGFAFAGKNAYRVNKIISVKELMDSLKYEFSLAVDSIRSMAAPVAPESYCAAHP
jgi:nitronate monooxygenase